MTPIDDFVNGVTDLSDEAQSHSVRLYNATAECMRRKGWDYAPYVPEGKVVSGTQLPSDPQALLAWRRQNGYGLFALSAGEGRARFKATISRQYAYQQGLSPDARRRYESDLGVAEHDMDGRPPSGCQGDAATQINATSPAANEALLKEITELQQGARADPAYLEAATRWSQCMTGRGLTFRTPADANKAVSDRFNESADARADPTAAEEELRIATADAECSVDTVWPVQERLEEAIVQQIVDKYGEAATCGATCR